MATVKLKPAAKILLTLLAAGAGYGVYHFVLKDRLGDKGTTETATTGGKDEPEGESGSAGTLAGKKQFKVALSEWPGHMALVVGNGGLKTQAGSAAAKEGLDLEIVFIEDPVKKNAALQGGSVDFVWQVVDEMPINMVGFKKAEVNAKAFLQIDWSRGGDACVASKDVQQVEDILGKKSAMMMFSPDHTVFEFMINNSRLTPAQIDQVRKDTSFSMDDFTFGRVLFTQGKVDVACLWEPDVTLALKGRAGAHRLFSTADATELVADVLLTREELLEKRPEIAEKVAKVWLAGVAQAEKDRRAAAKLVSSVVPRFRNELGEEGTFNAFGWVKWTDLEDNARFFGLKSGGAAFDRVYNQADGIWTKYPQAKITDRFTPQALRNDSVIRKLWKERQAASAAASVKKEEAPKYEPKIAATGKAVFTKPVTINFSSGQSDLDTESMHILNHQVLPQLQMAGGMYVRVEGNTDNTGKKSMNSSLSEKRARSVVEFLVSKGVAAGRITAKGNGDRNPVASNKTADGRASNRRTDILFISGQAAN